LVSVKFFILSSPYLSEAGWWRSTCSNQWTIGAGLGLGPLEFPFIVPRSPLPLIRVTCREGAADRGRNPFPAEVETMGVASGDETDLVPGLEGGGALAVHLLVPSISSSLPGRGHRWPYNFDPNLLSPRILNRLKNLSAKGQNLVLPYFNSRKSRDAI